MQKNYKKELQLKGNSVKRLIKEFNAYLKEKENNETKLNELKESGADDYYIRKHNEFVEESVNAYNSAVTKLTKFTEELALLVNEIEDNEVKQLEEYILATEILNNSNQLLGSLAK